MIILTLFLEFSFVKSNFKGDSMKKEYKKLTKEELEKVKETVLNKMKELYPTDKSLKKAIKEAVEKQK